MHIGLAIVLSIWPASGMASILLKPTGTSYNSVDSNLGTKTTNSRTVLEMPFGYITADGWALQINYSTEKMLYKVESGFPSQTDSSRTSLGGGFGWISRRDTGPFVLGTYFFSSDYTSGSLLYKGTGYQLDAGVRFLLGRAHLAFQFSYKSYDYPKYTTSSTEVNI